METTTITLTARQRMRLALDLAGKTAQDAADALEVHPNTITNWLTGRTWPRKSDRREMARLLDMPLDFFDDPWMQFQVVERGEGPDAAPVTAPVNGGEPARLRVLDGLAKAS